VRFLKPDKQVLGNVAPLQKERKPFFGFMASQTSKSARISEE
jgi:hypothetical protein